MTRQNRDLRLRSLYTDHHTLVQAMSLCQVSLLRLCCLAMKSQVVLGLRTKDLGFGRA